MSTSRLWWLLERSAKIMTREAVFLFSLLVFINRYNCSGHYSGQKLKQFCRRLFDNLWESISKNQTIEIIEKLELL